MNDIDPTGADGTGVTPAEGASTGRDPSLEDVFLGDPRLVFLRDRESGDAVCYEWDPRSDDDTLVMKNERMLPEGFPFTTRLVLDRREYQMITTTVVEESDRMTTYALRHESRGETGENYRLSVRTYPGPRDKDQTYFGVFHDLKADKQYEVFAAVDANPVIVAIVAIAILCAGVIAIDAIRGECAERCKTACGGGGNVASCEANVTILGKWSNGFSNSCSVQCNATCKTAGGGGGGSGGGGSGSGGSDGGSSGGSDGGSGSDDGGSGDEIGGIRPVDPVVEIPEGIDIVDPTEDS
ncbi:hypothetical protein [Haloplanus salilacus]|uniref:hypothetical protein n=1 Tax=Haloplanus salilacus TaxID=2949994 RepID=UPI0030D465E1